MEGPTIRHVPRTALDAAVELRCAGRTMRMERPLGNVSATGLFVAGQDLPVGASVEVRITAPRPFEAAGVVRHRAPRGVGIQFTDFHDGNRQRLDDLIEDLTLRGLPAC